MKMRTPLLVFIAIVGVATTITDALLIHRLLDPSRPSLLQIQHEHRLNLDNKLGELFPEHREQIKKLHDANNECYDQTVGVNATVNIFKDKVTSVVHSFVVSVWGRGWGMCVGDFWRFCWEV